MISINIRFEAQLRDWVTSNPLQVFCEEPATVLGALHAIPADQDVTGRLFDASGQLHSSLLVFLNDQPIIPGGADGAAVHDGDTILLFPPIAGG